MTAIQALLGFAAWTVLLVAGVFVYRSARFLGGTPINSWPRGSKFEGDAPIMTRLQDAHANCLENLPVFAVIVLAALATGRGAALEPMAAWVLYARVAQSLVHLSGVGRLQVLVRATFWSVQLALFAWMLVKLL